MRISTVNQCDIVALFAVFIPLLLLRVALGEISDKDIISSVPVITYQNDQLINIRPRERSLLTAFVWCIAKSNASDVDLQAALDWVCGPKQWQGQANCGPAESGGACFDPDTTFHHSSWAFNDYFHRVQNATITSCNFSGTAQLTTIDPSQGTCVFPGSTITVYPDTTINGTFSPSASPEVSPAASPELAPGGQGPVGSTSAAAIGSEPSYLFRMSTAVTLVTYLFI